MWCFIILDNQTIFVLNDVVLSSSNTVFIQKGKSFLSRKNKSEIITVNVEPNIAT